MLDPNTYLDNGLIGIIDINAHCTLKNDYL